jgi:hypothetical protein
MMPGLQRNISKSEFNPERDSEAPKINILGHSKCHEFDLLFVL